MTAARITTHAGPRAAAAAGATRPTAEGRWLANRLSSAESLADPDADSGYLLYGAQPLVRWVQADVDRRSDHARYDAQRMVDAFGERLRGQVALDAVAGDLQATIDDAVRPTVQARWLREAVS
jgi:hypothetical protein